MAVAIICPNLRCRSVLAVSDSMRGQKVRCSRCGKTFLVPRKEARDKAPGPATPAANATEAES